MKKRLLLLIILAFVLSACLVLSSCDKPNTDEGKEPSSSSSQNTENNTDNSQNNEQNVTVTFDTNGSSAIESVQVTKGEKVAKPQDPEKYGYTFDGWYADGEKWSFVGYVVTENMTLTAKWTPITYTITYVGNAYPNKTTYTVEDEVELLNGEGKIYYEFLGWYEDEEFTKQVTKIEKGTVGNKTLYAKTEYVPVVLELDGDSYKVVGYDKKTANVVIPSTYNGKNVTSIGEKAFYDCTSLTSITIGDSVTSIGNSAFAGCKSLTSITIGDNVTSIGNEMFRQCESLTSITIPNSITSIGNVAFSGCTNLTSITIPDSVTSIGERAFDWCTSLTIYCEATSQPDGWDTNWNFSNYPVVWNCNNSDVANDGYIYTVVDGIRYSIKDGAATVATQPKNIKEAIIKESITYKNVSYSVTSIGNSAFHRCRSLTSVVIPNSVTVIDNGAFIDCYGLESVSIGDSVTSIGYGAFYDCISLREIEIPNSVTSIGERAFYNCTSLTSIEIPDSVTSIGDDAFQDCTSLASVEIPNSVTSIGDYAFSGCTSLTSIEIPNSVTSIGNYAFEDCTSLVSIIIRNSVTSMGSSVFSGCALLTVYCEAQSKPSGWDTKWNYSNCPVVWGHGQGE